MESVAIEERDVWLFAPLRWAATALLHLLHLLISAPVELFLLTLGVMLFRPPDLRLYDLDRIAFGVLVFSVVLRMLLQGDAFRIPRRVALPMLALTILAFAATVSRAYEAEIWSVFAAKWLVPLAMFCLAGFVFKSPRALRQLEIFSWAVLIYLSAIAVLFLFNAHAWIFPRYILDPNLGIHAERARGPFLQAVANGMTLNLLALIALDSFRRRKLPTALAAGLFLLVPIAILATKTRAVWLSFGFSVLVLVFWSPSRRVRIACACLAVAAALGLWGVVSNADEDASFLARFEAASPVEFREVLYQVGWNMFKEKPVLGWPASEIQPELDRRINEFHQEAFYFHNTFLEVAVSYGLVGLGLYLWVVYDLFGLRRTRERASPRAQTGHFLDQGFRSLWPLLLAIYLLNACFVVMNYQFVNGFFFTIAGILAAQDANEETQGFPVP